MAIKKTANLQMNFLSQHQTGKDVIINENFDKIDGAIWPSIQDANINIPPVSNNATDGYIVGTAPQGDWVGKPNYIAIYRDTATWDFYSPRAGMMFFVAKKKAIFIFNGTNWTVQNIDTSNVPDFYHQDYIGIGVNVDKDTKFGVKSKNVLFQGEDGIDISIDRKVSTDTSTITMRKNSIPMFQMGMMGEDNFKIRVSQDGANYKESIAIQNDSGQLILKQSCYIENGIQFKGSNHALNSYDEGSWTPSLEGKTNKGSVTYSIRNGEFVKIGKLVYVFFFIRCSGQFQNGSGDLLIRGLPYTPSDANSFTGTAFMRNVAGLSAGHVPSSLGILTTGDEVTLAIMGVIGYDVMTAHNVGNDFEVRGGFFYAVK